MSSVCPNYTARKNKLSPMHRGGGGYLKSLFLEKILLLYHSVDPTDSQTDTEQGHPVLI